MHHSSYGWSCICSCICHSILLPTLRNGARMRFDSSNESNRTTWPAHAISPIDCSFKFHVRTSVMEGFLRLIIPGFQHLPLATRNARSPFFPFGSFGPYRLRDSSRCSASFRGKLLVQVSVCNARTKLQIGQTFTTNKGLAPSYSWCGLETQ